MFDLIIPFHTDYERIFEIIPRHRSSLKKFGVEKILLCHNGASLPQEEADRFYANSDNEVVYRSTSRKGIGAGYRLGIQNAEAEYLLLSASDLPFGTSDIEQFVKLHVLDSTLCLAIGSKAHHMSKLEGIPLSRRLYSYLFYLLRRFLLGSNTPKDSQGTIIVKTSLAKKLEPLIEADDYFFSLELLTLAEKMHKVSAHELPIIYTVSDRTSSVRPIRDGISMLFRLFSLRKRISILSNSDTINTSSDQ